MLAALFFQPILLQSSSQSRLLFRLCSIKILEGLGGWGGWWVVVGTWKLRNAHISRIPQSANWNKNGWNFQSNWQIQFTEKQVLTVKGEYEKICIQTKQNSRKKILTTKMDTSICVHTIYQKTISLRHSLKPSDLTNHFVCGFRNFNHCTIHLLDSLNFSFIYNHYIGCIVWKKFAPFTFKLINHRLESQNKFAFKKWRQCSD
jgi:hypothetical protein